MDSNFIAYILSEDPTRVAFFEAFFADQVSSRWFSNQEELISDLSFENTSFSVVVIDCGGFSLSELESAVQDIQITYSHIPVMIVGITHHNATVRLMRLGGVFVFDAFDKPLLEFCKTTFANYATESLKRYAAQQFKPDGPLEETRLLVQANLEAEWMKLKGNEVEFGVHLSLPEAFFRPQKQKVLVIDDQAFIAEAFRLSLEKIYTILDAKEADEALEILAQNKDVAVVVLDVELPGKKGHDLIPEIKKLAPKAMILMLTAYEDTPVAKTGFERGVRDYLNKSAHPETINQKIHDLVHCYDLENASGDLPFQNRFALFANYAKEALEKHLPIRPSVFKSFFPSAPKPQGMEDLWPEFVKYPTLEAAVLALLK
ncbi:MAG: response regulator transcription factor [Candidatus Margulisiibacteriota bacterium]